MNQKANKKSLNWKKISEKSQFCGLNPQNFLFFVANICFQPIWEAQSKISNSSGFYIQDFDENSESCALLNK